MKYNRKCWQSNCESSRGYPFNLLLIQMMEGTLSETFCHGNEQTYIQAEISWERLDRSLTPFFVYAYPLHFFINSLRRWFLSNTKASLWHTWCCQEQSRAAMYNVKPCAVLFTMSHTISRAVAARTIAMPEWICKPSRNLKIYTTDRERARIRSLFMRPSTITQLNC